MYPIVSHFNEYSGYEVEGGCTPVLVLVILAFRSNDSILEKELNKSRVSGIDFH